MLDIIDDNEDRILIVWEGLKAKATRSDVANGRDETILRVGGTLTSPKDNTENSYT